MKIIEELNSKPLKFIKGVGEKKEKILNSLGINSLEDLLFYFPSRYYDKTNILPLSQARLAIEKQYDEVLTFLGKITSIKKIFTPRRKMLEIIIEDKGYYLKAFFLNAIDIFEKIFAEKKVVAFSGKLSADSIEPVLFHPQFDFIDETIDADFYYKGQIVPFYSLRGINQLKQQHFGSHTLREIIRKALETEINSISETIPEYILKERNLLPLKETVKSLHFPPNFDNLKEAKSRMKFEEMFYYQLISALNRFFNKQKNDKIKFNKIGDTTKHFLDKILPFELTDDQKKVLKEIYKDFSSGLPMNRLLQGEVGSGKTIVALISSLICFDNGFQIAIMAPTEILANQHYKTFTTLLEKLNITACLLTGSTPTKIRKRFLEDIKNGKINIVIGTHALIEKDIEFSNLGYVIIDEQHRFGVMQRAELKNKAISAHFLVMTATPIPRTLTMTLFSSLDVSIIKELPKNRIAIKTYLVGESKRERIYKFIRKEVQNCNGIYIIYPLIEESEKLDLKAVVSGFERLKNIEFPDLSVGMLHGKMTSDEKDDVMTKFIKGEVNILVSTTVVEVGVDNPNATIMLIEEPQRFGLSQLHQLRGRIGRGDKQSYCILIAKEEFVTEEKDLFDKDNFIPQKEKDISYARKRLHTFAKINDGFKISEEDLKLRGPGNVFGTKQSGIPEFNFIDLAEDIEIIEKTKELALEIIKNDHNLSKSQNAVLRKTIISKYKNEIVLSKIS